MNRTPSSDGCSRGQRRRQYFPAGVSMRKKKAPLKPPAKPSASMLKGRYSKGIMGENFAKVHERNKSLSHDGPRFPFSTLPGLGAGRGEL